MKTSTQKVTDGSIAFFYTLLLLGSAFIVPSIWFFLERHFSWHNAIPQLLAGVFFLIFLYFLPKQPLRLLAFLIFGGLFFWSMFSLKRPVERIHFIEYGLLSFVLFRSFRHFLKVPWNYGAAIMATIGIGVVDELLQGILPNRVYDPRDIWINVWAGGLGMVAVFFCFSSHTL